MIIYGISANEHDAAVAVCRDDTVVFASHAERFSRRKNDPDLNADLLAEAAQFGEPDLIAWYENPFAKRLRKLWSGQYTDVFGVDGVRYMRKFGLTAPSRYVGHHECHAANGFYMSGFERAAVLVVDAIGEWDTISMWRAAGTRLDCVFRRRYPHSLGLLYSAFTQRLGMKPNEEEYILMGMAAYGKPRYAELIKKDFIESFDPPTLTLSRNVHRGILDWRPDIHDREDLAASIQTVAEEVLLGLVKWLSETTGEENLVLSGGVAMNCVANTRIARAAFFRNIWISPDPGDAGSSVGAIAALLRRPLTVPSAYLGHNIDRPFNSGAAVRALLAGEVIGVANGRAEFGPRALGNRSLLIDPRSAEAKKRLNLIKRREQFRPFAPVIMEEYAHDHFDMPTPTSPYMQFVANVRNRERYPAISHVDGTARVQTVTAVQNPVFYGLLSDFHAATGCPMLLNTSLNIKGEPLVNTWTDAMKFSALHHVQVF